jgi:hypothetical protein
MITIETIIFLFLLLFGHREYANPTVIKIIPKDKGRNAVDDILEPGKL